MIGEALLTNLSCMGKVCPQDADAIRLISGEVRTIRRHKDILSPGDVPRFVVIVLHGFLCRYTTSSNGKRQIHGFCMPTDAPALEALHLDCMDDSVTALVSSVVGLVPHANFFRLMEKYPRVATLMARAAAVQGSLYRHWLFRNSNQPAVVAMADLFCETYVRADAAGLVGNGSCDLPVTQENLGEALGLTAVHVNRTLQILRRFELVEMRRGRLLINDFAKLAKLAEFDPRYLHLSDRQSLDPPLARGEFLLRAAPFDPIVVTASPQVRILPSQPLFDGLSPQASASRRPAPGTGRPGR